MNSREMVRNFYENIISGNLIEEIAGYVSVDSTARIGEQGIPLGLEGIKQHAIDVRKTYPDMKIRVLRQHSDGDFVISEIVMEGTHQGEWLGIRPSGKKLSITGVNIDRISGGKITEHGGAANVFDAFWAEGLIRAKS
jgi:predicted ester cyclase